jgi:hypothetical protein
MITKVKEKVAGEVFMILIQQLRDQAFIIDNDQSEALRESFMGDSDIFGKKFDIDSLISAPKSLIESAKQQIKELKREISLRHVREDALREEVKELNKTIEESKLSVSLHKNSLTLLSSLFFMIKYNEYNLFIFYFRLLYLKFLKHNTEIKLENCSYETIVDESYIYSKNQASPCSLIFV